MTQAKRDAEFVILAVQRCLMQDPRSLHRLASYVERHMLSPQEVKALNHVLREAEALCRQRRREVEVVYWEARQEAQ